MTNSNNLTVKFQGEEKPASLRGIFVHYNRKGGAGKTFLSVTEARLLATESDRGNLKAAFERTAHKVLFIDLDSQQDATAYILDNDDLYEDGTEDGVVDAILRGDARPHIRKITENFFLLPAGAQLDNFSEIFKENIKDQFEEVADEYKLLRNSLKAFIEEEEIEYIIVDNAPSYGPETETALGLGYEDCKAEVIVPLQLDRRSRSSLKKVISIITTASGTIGLHTDLKYVLPLLYKENANIDKKYLSNVQEILGDSGILLDGIKNVTRLKEMLDFGIEENREVDRKKLEPIYELLAKLTTGDDE